MLKIVNTIKMKIGGQEKRVTSRLQHNIAI